MVVAEVKAVFVASSNTTPSEPVPLGSTKPFNVAPVVVIELGDWVDASGGRVVVTGSTTTEVLPHVPEFCTPDKVIVEDPIVTDPILHVA